jgi:Ca2+-binding RTX toxin-like protein
MFNNTSVSGQNGSGQFTTVYDGLLNLMKTNLNITTQLVGHSNYGFVSSGDTSYGYYQSADDVLYGGSGNDWLVGGRGNDTIYGGQGNDVMWGIGGGIVSTVNIPAVNNTNNDVFSWQRGDAGTGASDQIRDFTPWAGTTGMKIDLSGLLENHAKGSLANLDKWITSITTASAGTTAATALNNEMNSLFGDSIATNLAATKMVIDVDGAGAGTATQTIYFRNWAPSTTVAATWVSNGWLVV